jgi:hypothetical protein
MLGNIYIFFLISCPQSRFSDLRSDKLSKITRPKITYDNLKSCTNFSVEAELLFDERPIRKANTDEWIKNLTTNFITVPNNNEPIKLIHLESGIQSLKFFIKGNI